MYYKLSLFDYFKGGIAVADYNSVTEGEKIINTAVEAFGSVHILINNAGILRDRSIVKMSNADWGMYILCNSFQFVHF